MGRIAVQRMLERGDQVAVFSRGNTRPEWWDRVEHILGDRKDRADFGAKLRGREFDAVLDTQAFRKEDVESAEEIFRGHVGRYLMVSTGSVYQDGKLDFTTHCPFRESDVDWGALDYTYPEGESAYGVGKRHCEKWLQENSAVPYTVVRVPAVMGWDDPSARMWWWVQRALDGREVMIPMEHRAPFRTLYFEDAAANFLRALDAPAAANQIYHIATQEVLTNERWVSLLWEAAGHEGRITYVPLEVIQRHEGLDAYSSPLTRSIPYVHDLAKAERDFGFRTTPVAEWIRTTVEWYRTHDGGATSQGYDQREQELMLARKWGSALDRLVVHFVRGHSTKA
jgi:nucleoside-diphosphate-sugar epimerase